MMIKMKPFKITAKTFDFYSKVGMNLLHLNMVEKSESSLLEIIIRFA